MWIATSAGSLMSLCLMGLGSNVGDRRQTLDEAVARLALYPGVKVVGCSPWQETLPVGGPPSQSSYLNGAVLIETSLSPETLLGVFQRLEAELGRTRDQRWGPRTIDLDLLLYDRLVLTSPWLTVPHPRMAWRRFVLEPAARIAPDMVHPTIGWTLGRLLDHLNTSAFYVAIAGAIGAGKSHLARQIADRADVRLLEERIDLPLLEAFYRNPSGHAWQIELEFLEQRIAALSPAAPGWQANDRPTVSDFWFDQSIAFARVWLSDDQWKVYRSRWQEARQGVVRPRLTVLIEAPTDELMRRIAGRARAGESLLTAEQVDRIARCLQEQAQQPDTGPLLRLTDGDLVDSVREVLAAIEGMK
jgi:2-amino-4-hydroxy-6-hydroxymethyldihydropteridine diphosphokinase